MKKNLLRSILYLWVLCWHGYALAIPMAVTPETGASGPSDAESAIPWEVNDQFSKKDVSTLSEKVLAARSSDLRDQIIKTPGNPYLLHELGTITFHQGMTNEALGLWKAAYSKEPNLTPPMVMEAIQGVFLQLEKGKKAEAEKQLAAAELKFANQPHFQLIKAEQAMRSKNFAIAEKAYLKALELGPELYVTALNLGRFYEFIKRDAAVINKLYLSAAQLAPKEPEVWKHLGIFQFHQKQSQAAFESFRRMKELAPDAQSPEIRLAELSIAAGDYAGTESWYRKALGTKLSAEEEQQIRMALGDVLLRLGKLKEARREIESVLKQKEMPQLVFALATIDESEGKRKEAEQGYRRVLELMPENPLAANNLAMLLIRSNGSADEALKLAEQARKAIPNNLIIESTYGCALVETGSAKEGVAVLETVTQSSDNKDAWAYFCQAKGLEAIDRREEAKELLKKVLLIDPHFQKKAEVQNLGDK